MQARIFGLESVAVATEDDDLLAVTIQNTASDQDDVSIELTQDEAETLANWRGAERFRKAG